MKAKFFLIATVMFCMTVSSCNRGQNRTGMYESDHYIQTYYDIENVRAHMSNNWPGMIFIEYEAKEYDNHEDDETSTPYNNLAERYDDFGYGGAVHPGMYRAICNEFTGIDVVSDHDFNDIPAGESLGGVVMLLTSSAKHYIESKYTDGYDWGNLPEDYIVDGKRLITESFEPGFWPVYGALDLLDPFELVLLHWEVLWLKFTETPAIKEHNLTITFSDAKNDFSCELAYTFM